MGNIRTWTLCKFSFDKFFKNLNSDFFLTTYDILYDYHPAVKASLNCHEDQALSDNEIFSMFADVDLKKIDIERNVDYSEYLKAHPQMNHEISFRQCRKYKRGVQIIKDYEKENNFQYDYIIKTRCDLIYNDIELKLSPDCFIINDIGSDGVFPNDWIFATNRTDMEKIADFMFDEFFYYTNPTSNINSPHQLLHNAIEHCNLQIKKMPIVQTLLRKQK